tara:strand:+ start:1105 stop:2112 length:1008 start_codon:yes stop_codon:yes gene_type:complete
MTNYANFKMGIEIEFKGVRLSVVEAHMARHLPEISVKRERYNHATQSYWKLVTDNTVSTDINYAVGDAMGGELVSPPMQGEDGFHQLRKVLFVLNTIDGIYVDVKCGVHVHLSWADMDITHVKNVIRRYAKYETEIDSFIPESRRADRNQWCCSIMGGGLRNFPLQSVLRADRLVQISRLASKYHKVSLAKIIDYGTVEFRQHSGTTDYTKISNWVKFLISFVEASKDYTEGASTNYKRKKKIAFGEIREQVAAQGWDLRFAGNKYKLFDSEGQMHGFQTMEQLDAMYVEGTRTLNQNFTAWFETYFTVQADCLLNGVADSVKDYLNQRAAQLAA